MGDLDRILKRMRSKYVIFKTQFCDECFETVMRDAEGVPIKFETKEVAEEYASRLCIKSYRIAETN
ncbi:MAG TPA: hypothetical protein ENI61_04265 [Ignavibacteria bacterium]|nr:hypothetical protein [Ignavibacteria bacterium]